MTTSLSASNSSDSSRDSGGTVAVVGHRGERIPHPQLVVARCGGGERVLLLQFVGSSHAAQSSVKYPDVKLA